MKLFAIKFGLRSTKSFLFKCSVLIRKYLSPWKSSEINGVRNRACMEVRAPTFNNAWQKHRVLIATPGLLLVFLRTVALALQQQDMQENAPEDADLGKELHNSLRTCVI